MMMDIHSIFAELQQLDPVTGHTEFIVFVPGQKVGSLGQETKKKPAKGKSKGKKKKKKSKYPWKNWGSGVARIPIIGGALQGVATFIFFIVFVVAFIWLAPKIVGAVSQIGQHSLNLYRGWKEVKLVGSR